MYGVHSVYMSIYLICTCISFFLTSIYLADIWGMAVVYQTLLKILDLQQ